MTNEAPDKVFIEYIVKAMVDNPDDVEVERKVDEMGVLLSLKVNREDMGIIIGRSGQTARAIRTLLRIVGARHHASVNLKIEEPEGGSAPYKKAAVESSPKNVDDVVDELKL